MTTPASGSTIDPAEVARFAAMADTWWDPKGPMRVLHRFNPARIAYIRDQALAHFRRDGAGLEPLRGLSIADVGCGGGVLSIPLARLGAQVTGIDPAPANVGVATLQAQRLGVPAHFTAGTIEEAVAQGERFDIVLAMEVVEHVADMEVFVRACAAAVRPGGLLVMATINRTVKSFALAIVGAEYVLRWLPRGTHDWERFVTPDELCDAIADAGLAPIDRRGVVYRPLAGTWSLSPDTDVNYMVAAGKP